MVISVADAYALGPDGQVDMDLFRQFADQQQAALTPQGGTGPSMGNANLTLGQQYMAGNPDVQQDAIRRANAEGLTGGDAFSNRLDEIALEHYNNFGRAEGRTGYGYSAPSSGSFLPSPNDIPSFGAGDRGRTNTPGANINPGTGQPFTPAPGQTGLGFMPGGGFDNFGYQTALNNFGGLLSNYGDFFGGLLSGAQNAQTNMQPQGQNYTGFYGPGQAPSFSSFNPYPSFSGGFSNGSTWGGGNATSGGNTGHRQLWTV